MAKARLRVAVAHRKVRDRRADHHHKLALRLIRENQAIAVEDLAVSGLARTRLAKSVHDAGWTMFVRLLENKAAQHGRQVVKVGRWTPTSQTCFGVWAPRWTQAASGSLLGMSGLRDGP